MAILIGGNGPNTLIGTAESDTLYGLDGDDALEGGAGADILAGGNGDDVLTGGRGADTLQGGAGNDTFRYLTLEEISQDRIIDLSLGDRLDFSAIAGLSFIGDHAFSGLGSEMRLSHAAGQTVLSVDIRGYGLADLSMVLDGTLRLVETAPGSRILILATRVTLEGGTGGDVLSGGAGDDRISGLGGDDTLSGGDGDDRLLGGDGADILAGGRGADTLSGGEGDDTFRYADAAEFAGDVITDFSGGDRIDFSAATALRFIGDAAFSGAAGEMRQSGAALLIDADGDGQADITASLPDAGMLTETAAGSRILVRAEPLVLYGGDAAEVLRGGAAGDLIESGAGNDTLFGQGGNDRLFGQSGNDTLDGGTGDDLIDGGSGNDILYGGAGNDSVIGSGGDDILIGGLGRDILRGGTGNDTFRYVSLAELDGDTIRDMEGGDRIDLAALAGLAYVGAAAFSGLRGEIRFDGRQLSIDGDGDGQADAVANVETGGFLLDETAPGSRILLRSQNRVINGTAAADALIGGGGDDTLNGNGGHDTLSGGFGNDMLRGGAGNDVLDGGAGDDILEGGSGSDVFVIGPEGGVQADTILDFAAEDRIQLTGFRDLVWVGDDRFSGVRPEARQSRSDAGMLIQIDADGDGQVDQTVLLRGGGSLKETGNGSRLLTLAAGVTRTGTVGRDTIAGAAGDDILSGGDGNDILAGRAGADVLEGGAGDDFLKGESGDDVLSGGAGNDTLIGGPGRDVLTGGAGADIFKYMDLSEIGMLEDRITDFGAGDWLDFRYLADFTFSADGLTGRAGQMAVLPAWRGLDAGRTFVAFDIDGDAVPDAMLALDGDLLLEEKRAGSNVLILAESRNLSGGDGADTLTGRAAHDALSGNGGDDVLDGRGGNDVLRGGAGNDRLLGGAGEDALWGDEGDDTLDGGAGKDVLRGGDGNDLLIGGLDADTLTGGAGADTFRYASAAEMMGDLITDMDGADRIDLSALGARFVGAAAFVADGTAQLRAFHLGQAMIALDSNGDGIADAVLSLAGTHWLEETAPGSGILRRVPDLVLVGTAGRDTLAGREGDDSLSGGGGDDILSGGIGQDRLDGGDGADVLRGDAGDDVLLGGAGADTLHGGPGSDSLTGGAGNDVFVWDEADRGTVFYDVITDFALGDTILLAGLQARFLGASAFTGTGAAEIRQAGSFLSIDGNGDGLAESSIQVTGLSALLEEVEAGTGLLELAPPLNLLGTAGDDRLVGRGNNDTLSGGAGHDALIGGGGNDVLTGGPGADTLTGGAGNDRFVFADGDVGLGAARDVITDFSTALYTDLLDLSGIDANTGLAGDQGFVLIAGNAATAPGQLWFRDGILFGNVDADPAADFEIALTGVASLSSWHFAAF